MFVVDEYPLVQEGVRSALEATGRFRVIGTASGAQEALDAIADVGPDLLVSALTLGSESGYDLVRDVRLLGSGCRCILLAATIDAAVFYRAIRAGVMALVPKADAPDRLVNACDQVMAGRVLLSPELLTTVERARARQRSRLASTTVPSVSDLTPQETRVLGLVAQGRTNREIAEELGLAEKTIRNYVSNMLRKMGMKNRTEAAAWVAGMATG